MKGTHKEGISKQEKKRNLLQKPSIKSPMPTVTFQKGLHKRRFAQICRNDIGPFQIIKGNRKIVGEPVVRAVVEIKSSDPLPLNEEVALMQTSPCCDGSPRSLGR